jgi:3'-phosphoadenosine 5'-phosphosulfate sulfotransferase (PAPS reductase)/FAD synthetase
MAKRIAVTTLNASTVDIINTIRANASYEYQSLVPEITEEPEMEYLELIDKKTGKPKRQAKWYCDALKLSPDERAKVRSKTFPGVARKMAETWGTEQND